MRQFTQALCGLTLAAGIAVDAQAFSQETHKRIAIDAVNYMKANPYNNQLRQNFKCCHQSWHDH